MVLYVKGKMRGGKWVVVVGEKTTQTGKSLDMVVNRRCDVCCGLGTNNREINLQERTQVTLYHPAASREVRHA
jgi:hypothetical protein